MDVISYFLGKKSSGGGSSDLDWTALGYSKRPQAIDDAYNYSLQIKNNWEESIVLNEKFRDDNNLFYMPLVNTSTARFMQSMFNGCKSLTDVPLLDTSQVSNFSYMFSGCKKLKNVPQFNTSNATDMTQMFYDCSSMTSIPLLNTSKVRNMSSMFRNCTELTSVPLLNTDSLTNITIMFHGCLKLSDATLDNILQMAINAKSYTSTKTLVSFGITDTTVYPASRIEALPHYNDFINAGWTIS